MKRALLVLAVSLSFGSLAHAQITSPYAQRYAPQTPFYAPPVSPYLNLVRSPNPALGYYLGTLPEVDRLRFQGQVLSGQANPELFSQQPDAWLEPGAIPKVPPTGHLSAFQAFGSYYNYGVQQRPYYPLNPNQARMLPK